MPVTYKNYVDGFSKDIAGSLLPHRPIDHAMDLEAAFNFWSGRIKKLSRVQLNTLTTYIEIHLAKGFMQWSSSSTAATTEFAMKEDGELLLCGDHCAFKNATVHNQYPLPLMMEMLNRLQGAQIFTKLDLKNANHLI
jgi:hypothetical protein